MKKFFVLGATILCAILSIFSMQFFSVAKIMVSEVSNIKGVYASSHSFDENYQTELTSSSNTINYVSLGDSIASGHKLSGWVEGHEYGREGNWDKTVLNKESYTYLIDQHLKGKFGADGVNTVSYAKSGETIEDLLEKLTSTKAEYVKVQEAVKNADLITISIGANNVLGPGMNDILGFITPGSTMSLAEKIQNLDAGLASGTKNFPILLNQLSTLNPNARVVFMPPHHPYRNFGVKPNAELTLFHLDIASLLPWGIGKLLPSDYREIKYSLAEKDFLEQYFIIDRVNMIGEIAGFYLGGGEKYYETEGVNVKVAQKDSLYSVIKSKIEESGNKNFVMADVYTAFGLRNDSPALSEDDVYRSGPGTSRKKKGVVNAWFNQETGVFAAMTKFVATDWGQTIDAGKNAAINEVGSIGWGWVNNNFGENTAQVVAAARDAFFKKAGELLVNDLMFAVDPHPTVGGHEVIAKEMLDQIKTVKFEAQGGSVSKKGAITGEGLKLSEPTNPTRTGYSFKGWYKENSCVNAWNFNSDVVAGDTTLYAGWEPNIYKVSLNNQGATTAGTAEYYYKYNTVINGVYYYTDANCTLPLNNYTITKPTKTGYTFDGYYTENNGNGTQYINADGMCVNDLYKKVANNTTLYAKWKINSYTLTVNANGGTMYKNLINPSTIASNWTSELGSNDGLKITYDPQTGMYSMSATNGNDPFATIIPTTELTSGNTYIVHIIPSSYMQIFYAKGAAYAGGMELNFSTTQHQQSFTANASGTYNFRFDPPSAAAMTAKQFWISSATPTSTYTQVLNYSEYYQIPLPTRVGYTFTGWEVSGGATITTDGIVQLTSDATLTAQWKANNYLVTFNGNNGIPSQTEKTVTYNSAYGTLPTATRTGYTFAGWYTAQNGGSKVESSTMVVATNNHTLYAQWTVNRYVVTFDPNNGTVSPTSQTITFNANYGAMPTPARAGYTFNGWFTSATSGTKVEATTKVTTANNHTLFAQWTLIPTTITTSKTTAEETYGYAEAFNVSTITAQGGGDDWTYLVSNSTNFNIVKNANGTAILKFKTGADAGTYTTTVTATSIHNGTTATTEEITVTINQADFDLTAVWSTTKVGYVEITSSVVIECITYLFKDGVHAGSSTYASGVGAGGLYECEVWGTYGHTREREKGAYSVVVVARPENSNYKQKQVNTDEVLAYKVTLVAGEGITEAFGSQNCNEAMLCGEEFIIGVVVEDGYTWSKWIHEGATLTNFNPTKDFNFSIVMGAGDVTLTATATRNAYTIKYNGNGATGGTTEDSTHVFNTAKELSKNGFTKNGYKFVGWATSESGNVVYTDQQSVTNLSTINGEIINLYAKWEVVPTIISSVDIIQTEETYGYDKFDVATIMAEGESGDDWTYSVSNPTNFSIVKNANGTATLKFNTGADVGTYTTTVTATSIHNGTTATTEEITVIINSIAITGSVSMYGTNVVNDDFGYLGVDIEVDQQGGDCNYEFRVDWYVNSTKSTTGGTLVQTEYGEQLGYVGDHGEFTLFWLESSHIGKYVYAVVTVTDIEDKNNYVQAEPWVVFATEEDCFSERVGVSLVFESECGWIEGGTGNTIITVPGSYQGELRVNTDYLAGEENLFLEIVCKYSDTPTTVTIFNENVHFDIEEFGLCANGSASFTWTPNTVSYIKLRQVQIYNLSVQAGQGIESVAITHEHFNTPLCEYESTLTAEIKEGYTFYCWRTSPTIEVSYDQIFIWDHTYVDGHYTAVAKPNKYYIVYNGNGNTSGKMSKSSHWYDVDSSLSVNSFVKEGYAFSHWNTASDDSGTRYEDGQDIINLIKTNNGNVSLYAQWVPTSVEYTVYHFLENLRVDEPLTINNSTLNETEKLYGYADIEVSPAVKEYVGFISPEIQTVTILPNGSLEVFYFYARKSYNLTLVADNGVESVSGSGVYDYEQEVQINAAIKVGYTWKSWTISGAELLEFNPETKYQFIKIGVGDVLLTANATANKYTVTLDAKGGNVSPSTITVTFASEYGDLPTPDRTGYTFSGWYLDTTNSPSSRDIKKVESTTLVETAKNHTLVAQWTANKYEATFNPNGGEIIQTNKDITFDSPYGEMPSPTRTGYSFNGWYTSSEGGNIVSEGTILTTPSDHELYAQWTANSYKVTFNPNGGTLLGDQEKIVQFDGQYLELPKVRQEGKASVGWFTESGVQINENSIVSIAEDHVLYAHWEELVCSNNGPQYATEISNVLTVNFSINVDSEVKWFDNNEEIIGTNDNSLSYKPTTFGEHKISCEIDGVNCGGIYIAYYQAPTTIEIEKEMDIYMLNRYSFVAKHNSSFIDESKILWYEINLTGGQNVVGNGLTADFSVNKKCTICVVYDDGINSINASTDQIKPKNIITFDSKGGNPCPTKQYVYQGEKLSEPKKPAKENYIFAGWYKDSGLTNIWDFNTCVVEEDIVLYAKWVKLECLDNRSLLQYTTNLKNIRFTIDLQGRDVEWLVNGTVQENLSDNTFVFSPNENNSGIFTINCRFNEVLSNSFEIVIYYVPSKLEIKYTKQDLGKYQLIVIDNGQNIDESKIVWYVKENGEDRVIGRGLSHTINTTKSRVIYAVYEDDSGNIVSNLVKITIDITPYMIRIGAIVLISVLCVTVVVVLIIKFAKMSKRKRANKKLFKDYINDKKER